MKTIFIVFVIFVSSLINPDNKNKNFKINYIGFIGFARNVVCDLILSERMGHIHLACNKFP